jgi:hypothetical protein
METLGSHSPRLDFGMAHFSLFFSADIIQYCDHALFAAVAIARNVISRFR